MKYKFIPFHLLKKILAFKKNKKLIKTYYRSAFIFPFLRNCLFGVYNGKMFIPVFITDKLIGHKLGEFAPTRQFKGHSSKKVEA